MTLDELLNFVIDQQEEDESSPDQPSSENIIPVSEPDPPEEDPTIVPFEKENIATEVPQEPLLHSEPDPSEEDWFITPFEKENIETEAPQEPLPHPEEAWTLQTIASEQDASDDEVGDAAQVPLQEKADRAFFETAESEAEDAEEEWSASGSGGEDDYVLSDDRYFYLPEADLLREVKNELFHDADEIISDDVGFFEETSEAVENVAAAEIASEQDVSDDEAVDAAQVPLQEKADRAFFETAESETEDDDAVIPIESEEAAESVLSDEEKDMPIEDIEEERSDDVPMVKPIILSPRHVDQRKCQAFSKLLLKWDQTISDELKQTDSDLIASEPEEPDGMDEWEAEKALDGSEVFFDEEKIIEERAVTVSEGDEETVSEPLDGSEVSDHETEPVAEEMIVASQPEAEEDSELTETSAFSENEPAFVDDDALIEPESKNERVSADHETDSAAAPEIVIEPVMTETESMSEIQQDLPEWSEMMTDETDFSHGEKSEIFIETEIIEPESTVTTAADHADEQWVVKEDESADNALAEMVDSALVNMVFEEPEEEEIPVFDELFEEVTEMPIKQQSQKNHVDKVEVQISEKKGSFVFKEPLHDDCSEAATIFLAASDDMQAAVDDRSEYPDDETMQAMLDVLFTEG